MNYIFIKKKFHISSYYFFNLIIYKYSKSNNYLAKAAAAIVSLRSLASLLSPQYKTETEIVKTCREIISAGNQFPGLERENNNSRNLAGSYLLQLIKPLDSLLELLQSQSVLDQFNLSQWFFHSIIFKRIFICIF